MKSDPLQKEKLTKLLQLIELTNCAPEGGLPDFDFRGGPTTLEAFIESWERNFSGLDPKLLEFIGSIHSERAADKYRMLQQATNAMRSLAVKEGEVKKEGEALALIKVSLQVNSEGKIIQIPNRLLQCLDGLEAGRIRQCRCGRVFWATRKDQNACGPEHANVRRVRKFRGSSLL
jgi:hypothetical protein